MNLKPLKHKKSPPPGAKHLAEGTTNRKNRAHNYERFIICCLVAAVIAIFAASNLMAQISLGGTPRSFSNSFRAEVQSFTMAPVDVKALLHEDSLDNDKGVPYRFGFPFDVNYSMKNSGTWETLADGGKIWRLNISSPGAYSINLLYSMYHLPEGADFYVYNADHSMVIGAFTARNNKENGIFATGLVKGDNVTLEYYEPANAEFPGEITVSRVVHAYHDLFDRELAKGLLDFGGSGSCNNNVNCPIGAAWQTQKRSVAMILTSGGSRLCTGSMINNVRQDKTPYFITANHCLGGESSWIFMFNYESPNCTNIDGPTYMTVQGCTLKASYSTSDFGLLLLTETPPDSFKITFNGWNNVNANGDSAVVIHHPSGDIKKISFDYGFYTSTNYYPDTVVNPSSSHWRIGQYESGTTEPGSSGSPLFDKHHRYIGQLHGGPASCTSITSDYYGKFAMSWLGGGTNSSQCKVWLDPDNTGATTLDPYDPFAGVVITHTALPDTKDTTNPYQVTCTITADAPLIADSLLLWYQISSLWHSDTLITTGNPNEYKGFIPPQAPGTLVNYYLRAHATNGKADTTQIYTFRVIKYAIILTPTLSSGSGAVGDTVFHNFTLKNDGILTDSFNLSLTGVNWPTTVMNAAGTATITGTGSLAPNSVFPFKVRVVVPVSFYGDADTVNVVATSKSDGTVTKTSQAKTLSAGQPLTIPFVDNFLSTTIDIGKWVYNSNATVDTFGINPPSAPYSLRINGDPVGADTLVSQAISLNGLTGVNVSYYFEKKGNGDSPEAGDDLFIEYYNNSGNWLVLNQHLGSGADMSSFQQVSVGVPTDGYHSAFRLRIRSTGTAGAFDDWFVDNIRIDYGPQISATPISFNKTVAVGDSVKDNLILHNTGLGSMTYTILNLPNFSKSMSLFDQLMSEGRVQPASFADPNAPVIPEVKGTLTTQKGPDVVDNAGGPDAFGYVWIDSDEPGGPTLNWVDIEATGTNITGLSDDNFAGPFPVGFAFPYYDSSYSQFWLGSNGLIGFGPTTDLGSLSNSNLPSSSTPNNIIALVWDDLNITSTTNTNGKALYQFIGGNLVIEYKNYPRFGAAAGGTINAEIILSPDGTILLQYQTIGVGFDVTQSSIGIENVSGTVGLQVAVNTNYLHDNLAIKITKPPTWLYFSKTSGSVAPGAVDTVKLKFSAALVDTGLYKSNIKIYSNDPDPGDNPLTVPAKMVVTAAYMCGDANADNIVNISDVVYVIAYIFSGGPAPNPVARGNVNCDALVNISDVVYNIAYIFSGGPAPCSACK